MSKLFLETYQVIDDEKKMRYNFPANILVSSGFGYVRHIVDELGDYKHINIININSLRVSAYETVYISLPYTWHLGYYKKMIADNPQIQFIIGGPSISFLEEKIYFPNVVFVNGLAEHYFVGKNAALSNQYTVSLPTHHGFNYYIVFPVSYGCYWNKCTFCIGYRDIVRYRDNLIENFEKLPVDDPNVIEIAASALTAEQFSLICTFIANKKSRFAAMVRCDEFIINTAKKFDLLPNLFIKLGVEAFGNTLLRWFKKGTDSQTTVNAINILGDRCHQVHLMILNAIHVLTKNDLKEERDVLKMIKTKNISWTYCNIYWDKIPEKMPELFTQIHFDYTRPFWTLNYSLPEARHIVDLNNERLLQIEEFLGPPLQNMTNYMI